MSVDQLLQQNREAIVERWLQAAFSVYPDEAAGAFRRQKDPFANPIGHSLRTGTREIFGALLDGMDSEVIRQHLQEIINIRAVQELSASRAVGFVFDLKDAVRQALGASAADPRLASELNRVDERIDQIALAAFDVYVACRERLSELRVNEVNRRVSWIAAKLGDGGSSEADADTDLQREVVP